MAGCVYQKAGSRLLGRVKALREYKMQKTKKGLRTFLGVVSFYSRYIQRFAQFTATLSPATAKAKPNIVWIEGMRKSFHTICAIVCDENSLEIPLRDDVFPLVTVTSGYGLKAVLQVKRHGEWTAAAFFSRKTRGPKLRYSASELEALAVVEAVKHFSTYLYGTRFTVFTDHKPLCSLLTSDHLNSRLKRREPLGRCSIKAGMETWPDVCW